MANFLQLCADLARESGAIGTPPASVTGMLPLRQAQAVGWVRSAWVLIQNLSPHWSFLRRGFEGSLVVGQTAYQPAELGIADRFAEWVEQTPRAPALSIYDPVIGRRDENWLNEVAIDRWRRSYDFGVHDNARPTEWSIGYDGSLLVGSAPDKAYKVRGEYRRTPQVLAADTDVPEMPERFHSAIVYRALMLMAESDEAPSPMSTGQLEFQQTLVNMQRDLLPRVSASAGVPMDRR